MSTILKFLREAFEEVTQKISWPSQEKVQEMGNYFLVGLLVATTLVGIVNIGFDKVMQTLYDYFK